MPLNRSERDPTKQAVPTTQTALEGTLTFASVAGVEVTGLGFKTRKSTTNKVTKRARPTLLEPFWTSQYTPRRAGALTKNAINTLVCAASVFVIGVRVPITVFVEDQESVASEELVAERLDRLCSRRLLPSMPHS